MHFYSRNAQYPWAFLDANILLSKGEGVYCMSRVYPRDMIGYGRQRPQVHWPGQARVAVQFVLNYEEGGESNILHGDAVSEQFLSEIVGASAYPARHMSMESLYEGTSKNLDVPAGW